jgi:hypothetical protein
MLSFRGVLGKVGKAIKSQAKLKMDLAMQRRTAIGTPSLLFPKKSKQRIESSCGRASRIMSRACKAGQPTGQVVLSYADALHVLNELNASRPRDMFSADHQ